MSATFTEDWFGEPSCQALAGLVKSVADVPGLIVEIGAWEGRSTIAMANAAYPRCTQSVDTWAGSPGEISADLARDRDVHATWCQNVARATKGNVVEWVMGWRDYVPTVDQPVALLFIDAEHTYTEVRDTIEAFRPLMAPGGIICGDDVHHPPIARAVVDTLGAADVTVEASLWIWRCPNTADLAEMYRERCEKPSDIYLHLPRMVALVEELDAGHVIELGSRSGVSTVAWLYALERNGGYLHTVDLDDAPQIGTWDHWRHIKGDDLDPAVLDQFDTACIVFIDTSHAYRQTCAELEAYLPLVRPGGRIVLHDTELAQPMDAPLRDGVFPVKRAVREFVKRHGLEWDNYPECNGLGIVKVV
jgi:predicted O-methyltransferase YrrM